MEFKVLPLHFIKNAVNHVFTFLNFDDGDARCQENMVFSIVDSICSILIGRRHHHRLLAALCARPTLPIPSPAAGGHSGSSDHPSDAPFAGFGLVRRFQAMQFERQCANSPQGARDAVSRTLHPAPLPAPSPGAAHRLSVSRGGRDWVKPSADIVFFRNFSLNSTQIRTSCVMYFD